MLSPTSIVNEYFDTWSKWNFYVNESNESLKNTSIVEYTD